MPRPSPEQLHRLLSSCALTKVEEAIAHQAGTYINREQAELCADLIGEEISFSRLRPHQIQACLEESGAEVIRFAGAVLSETYADYADGLDSEVDHGLAPGLGVTYAIFWIYLSERPEKLEAYLKRREIPDPPAFVEKLTRLYEAVANSRAA